MQHATCGGHAGELDAFNLNALLTVALDDTNEPGRAIGARHHERGVVGVEQVADLAVELPAFSRRVAVRRVDRGLARGGVLVGRVGVHRVDDEVAPVAILLNLRADGVFHGHGGLDAAEHAAVNEIYLIVHHDEHTLRVGRALVGVGHLRHRVGAHVPVGARDVLDVLRHARIGVVVAFVCGRIVEVVEVVSLFGTSSPRCTRRKTACNRRPKGGRPHTQGLRPRDPAILRCINHETSSACPCITAMGTLCLLAGMCTRTPTYGRILHLRAITCYSPVNFTFDSLQSVFVRPSF